MTTQWEYRIMAASGLTEKAPQAPNGAPAENRLNEWGSEGWELVGVVPGAQPNGPTLIFKRPTPE